MAKQYKLTADNRTFYGHQLRKLRLKGIVPANVYGKTIKSVPVQINFKEFAAIFNEAGETSVISLQVGDKTYPVLISELHLNPITSKVVHVDFRHVNLTEKINATIPLETVGESQAVKDGAVLVMTLDEVEVEALPTDLPEKITVDLTKLVKIGDSIMVSDLPVDTSKVSITSDPTTIVALVQEQKQEVEEPAPVEAAATPAAETKTETTKVEDKKE
jgi:large subunit ribosomal protein L25